MSERESGGGFFLGFLVGVAVGAVASLLMAPTSGEEIRREIGDRGLVLKDQAQKAAEEARAQALRMADQTKGQVEHLSERGRIVISENVKKAQELVQDTQTRVAGTGDATPV